MNLALPHAAAALANSRYMSFETGLDVSSITQAVTHAGARCIDTQPTTAQGSTRHVVARKMIHLHESLNEPEERIRQTFGSIKWARWNNE